MEPLSEGTVAPDFTLNSTPDKKPLGISVDGAWCHKAFAKDRKLQFPLLADFEPSGAASRADGILAALESIHKGITS